MLGSAGDTGVSRRFLANPARLAQLVIARELRPAPSEDAEGAPDEIAPLAQAHARLALASLVKELTDGESETATVAAANEILDRGFGKPVVDIGGTGLLPFLGRAPDRNVNLEIRDAARRYARLAIETLRKIADAGASATARVSAAKSLFLRGLGVAAPAKVDPLDVGRPVGKREQAMFDAKVAASGGDADWGDDLQPVLH